MGYAESVTFGRMYGLIALGVLTTTEFATICIDSLPKAPLTGYDRVMTYPSFCELLVRLSQKACPDANVASGKKLQYVKCARATMLLQVPKDSRWDCSGVLRGLFQLMWLACASNSPRALKITDVLKTDRVDVMKCHCQQQAVASTFAYVLESSTDAAQTESVRADVAQCQESGRQEDTATAIQHAADADVTTGIASNGDETEA
ncbi:hypothetical protein FI667_g8557, partial [Globisporangium splendens]